MNTRLVALMLLAGTVWAQAPDPAYAESFESVWKTVRDKHWDPALGGLDWQAVHDELRPRIDKATDNAQVRQILTEMLERLHLSHYRILPGLVYAGLGAGSATLGGDGETGIDLRVLDGQAVVSSVDSGSPAAKAGVAPGWIIQKVDSSDLAPFIKQFLEHSKDSTLRDLTLRRAILLRLAGLVGENVTVEFTDWKGWPVTKTMTHIEPRGRLTSLGFLGPSHVWLEARKLKPDSLTIQYIGFNLFLDPAHLMPEFATAVESCLKCDGFVIDLRGNPGGLGAMATGMASWFVDQKNAFLGTLVLRDTALKFVINARAESYAGPLAILVDGTSASTSEIMAGGLQDLKRAQIFGSRTAAAALPSVVEKLPNGDAFQFAIANYVSAGGKELEGNGVSPDVDAPLTRAALLAGKDPALDAAVEWIKNQKAEK